MTREHAQQSQWAHETPSGVEERIIIGGDSDFLRVIVGTNSGTTNYTIREVNEAREIRDALDSWISHMQHTRRESNQ